MLYKLLTESLKRTKELSKQKRFGLLTGLCKILNIYNDKLNAYAKINGLRLKRAGVTKRMLRELNLTFDSVSYPTILRLLDRYSDEAMQRINNWQGENLHHCGDNVDVLLKARYELQGKSTTDLHMYNNMLYRPRINLDHLSDVPPTVPELQAIPLSQFILNSAEQRLLLENLEHQVAMTWGKMDKLSDPLRDLAVDKTHLYSQEMKCVTEKVWL